MFKFFRRIRQDLLNANRMGKYFKYAIGEVILVVIGILIALQINNWNENQKLKSKTQEYYTQLLEDLSKDALFADQTINKFKDYLEELNAYENLYYNEETLTPLEAYEIISKLPVISTSFTFNSSTTETLQNSGDISLIPSEIRNRLIDLKRQQETIIKKANYTDEGKNGIIQRLNPLLGSTTLPKRLIHQPKMREFLNIDKNLREIILVYEGVHRWKSISEETTMDSFEEMKKEIDTIKTLIDIELSND